MAVVVQCYQCSTILELDDGFLGGVCRCSQCGSLLQVPKASSADNPKARPAAPGSIPSQPHRPSNPLADPGLSRGQFNPQKAAASATGSGAFARSPSRPSAATVTAAPPASRTDRPSPIGLVKKNNTPLFIGLAVVVLLVLICGTYAAISFLAASHDSKAAPGGNAPGKNTAAVNKPNTEPDATSGPRFLSIPLVGKKIIISMDGARSIQDSFDYLRLAVAQAAESLADDQELKVVIWKDSTPLVIPADAWAKKSALPALRAKLDAVVPAGASDDLACMKASIAMGGEQIIFVTAKYDLTPNLAETLLPLRKFERIDAVRVLPLGLPPASLSPLEQIVIKANGKFITADNNKLDSLTTPK